MFAEPCFFAELDKVEQLTTEEDTVTIELDGRLNLKAELNKKKSVADVRVASDTSIDGQRGLLTVDLPQCGTYLLDVYESSSQTGQLEYVKTYSITKRSRRQSTSAGNSDCSGTEEQQLNQQAALGKHKPH